MLYSLYSQPLCAWQLDGCRSCCGHASMQLGSAQAQPCAAVAPLQPAESLLYVLQSGVPARDSVERAQVLLPAAVIVKEADSVAPTATLTLDGVNVMRAEVGVSVIASPSAAASSVMVRARLAAPPSTMLVANDSLAADGGDPKLTTVNAAVHTGAARYGCCSRSPIAVESCSRKEPAAEVESSQKPTRPWRSSGGTHCVWRSASAGTLPALMGEPISSSTALLGVQPDALTVVILATCPAATEASNEAVQPDASLPASRFTVGGEV